MDRLFDFPNFQLVFWQDKNKFCVQIDDWNFKPKGCEPVFDMVGRGITKQKAVDNLRRKINRWFNYQEQSRKYINDVFDNLTYLEHYKE